MEILVHNCDENMIDLDQPALELPRPQRGENWDILYAPPRLGEPLNFGESLRGDSVPIPLFRLPISETLSASIAMFVCIGLAFLAAKPASGISKLHIVVASGDFEGTGETICFLGMAAVRR